MLFDILETLAWGFLAILGFDYVSDIHPISLADVDAAHDALRWRAHGYGRPDGGTF